MIQDVMMLALEAADRGETLKVEFHPELADALETIMDDGAGVDMGDRAYYRGTLPDPDGRTWEIELQRAEYREHHQYTGHNSGKY